MRVVRAAIIVLVALFSTVWAGAAASALDGDVRTVPAPNQVLSAPPPLFTVDPPDSLSTGSARILDSTGAETAQAELKPVAGGVLGWALPPLGTGVYLVSWAAGSAHGAVGFEVTDG